MKSYHAFKLSEKWQIHTLNDSTKQHKSWIINDQFSFVVRVFREFWRNHLTSFNLLIHISSSAA